MRWLTTAPLALVLAGAAVAGTAVAAGAATGPVDKTATVAACPTGWGSGGKSATESVSEPLKRIRTGQHACYDRMVFDVDGAAGKLGYHVGYVDKFHQDGSGELIPVSGGAVLQVFVNAPSFDVDTGKPSYVAKAGQSLPGVDITGYKTFKDTKFGASFEGQTQIAVGVHARLPFQVLQTGDKLIVDVAHTW